MCGRYRRTTSEDELARRYHVPIPPQRDLPISWNIAPRREILTIRFNPETKQRPLDTLRWGLIPNWAKEAKIAYRPSARGSKRSIRHRPVAKRLKKRRGC